jgi:sugar phosphate isomerase/epimerase
MEIGVVWRLVPAAVEADFARLRSLGFSRCHLSVADPGLYQTVDPAALAALAARAGMNIGAVWCGLGQPSCWDLVDGPISVGLVPETYRQARLAIIEACGAFCARLGVRQVITHAGFIPENEREPLYAGSVAALRQAARTLDRYGCEFLLESGQETPVTLRRTLEDMDCANAGVNLDTGNLILYGRGDPAGAVDMLGSLIRAVHAKDGRYPAGGRKIGEETPLFAGRVRFREVLSGLRQIGYGGDIMIEREISGEQKLIDLEQGRQALLALLRSMQ